MAKKKKSDAEVVSDPAGKASLFTKTKDIDASLDALFSTSLGPVAKPAPKPARVRTRESEDPANSSDAGSDIVQTSSGEDEEGDDDGSVSTEASDEDEVAAPGPSGKEAVAEVDLANGAPHGRRKRKHEDEELEDRYMQRLAREEVLETARLAKRQKSSVEPAEDVVAPPAELRGSSEISESPPPQHETVSGEQLDVDKAGRTVFLGNVSTDAMLTNTARKTLLRHITTHLDTLVGGEGSHKVVSLRFRSTAYGNAIPKRAAFAKKELMGATTKSTNAYAVYTTKEATRDAATHLNGSIVLGRHLRVDEVAHPAKTDHRRCVFVGNLGFVDDESANAESEPEEKKKKVKAPSDVEEGLWQEFSKVGEVESVRVVRDSKTRVGKGFAYVQFKDENAVEAALLLNDKRFPPMLPRKLRVTRAKAVKRNAAKSPALGSRAPQNGNYIPKVSAEQQSLQGRAGKLFGKAGAAQARGKFKPKRPQEQRAGAIKPPEAFIFEGHRATSGQKPKLKTKKAKGGKPQTRSSRRGAAWKVEKKKKGT